jgi:hypothetical protein
MQCRHVFVTMKSCATFLRLSILAFCDKLHSFIHSFLDTHKKQQKHILLSQVYAGDRSLNKRSLSFTQQTHHVQRF